MALFKSRNDNTHTHTHTHTRRIKKDGQKLKKKSNFFFNIRTMQLDIIKVLFIRRLMH